MQVSVESTGNLERRMTVEVPEDRIVEAVESRLKRMVKTVKLKGFRPGKVPFKVVKQRYEGQVRQEVVGELMQSTFYEALGQEKLRPAGTPSIEPAAGASGAGLAFTATFEVYPEIELASFEGARLEKPVSGVQDADIDEMVETIRKQHLQWEPVERAAEDGDRVVIDFVGSIDGEAFKGGEGKQVPVQLGEGRMIAGFEEGLKGAKPGEERTVEVTFPETYQVAELAGKPAQFAVTVHAVEASRLPELDEDFVKSLGVEDGSVEALRQEIRGNMERELEQALNARTKQAVMDKLLELNKVDLPKAMVETEAQHLMEQTSQNLMSQGGRREDFKLAPEMFQEQAERRVALGLLLAELIRAQGIKADPEKVKATVQRVAEPYEHPEEVMKWYFSDRQRLAEVESMVLEDEVVAWVLEHAQVEEKTVPFKEVMYPSRDQGEAA